MAANESQSPSPPWSSTAKLVVGLTIVGLIVALIINFRTIIGPLLIAFILAYMLHPVVVYLSNTTRLNWRMSVNLVYLLLVILLSAFFTLSGLAIVQQLQSLIRVVQNFINTLPDLVANLSTQEFSFGPLPFKISLSQFDLQTLAEQLLSTLQPMLGRMGTLVGTLATSAVVTLGWGLFILLISYFLLADASKVSSDLVYIEIPGYNADIRRLGNELINSWNAFLRGQLVIFILAILSYFILLNILGLRNALGIAILAGLARFVPYVGPFTTWTVTTLVAFFQGSNYFGLQPIQYTVLVIISAILLDQVFDNYISPRMLGQTLGVHPAAVLVGAIIAAKLIGIVGIVLAAPVLATLKILGRYILRKMLDLDPWLESETPQRDFEFPWARTARRFKAWRRLRKGKESEKRA